MQLDIPLTCLCNNTELAGLEDNVKEELEKRMMYKVRLTSCVTATIHTHLCEVLITIALWCERKQLLQPINEDGLQIRTTKWATRPLQLMHVSAKEVTIRQATASNGMFKQFAVFSLCSPVALFNTYIV